MASAFDQLPDAVLEQIFWEYCDDVWDILQLSGICKRWQILIQSSDERLVRRVVQRQVSQFVRRDPTAVQKWLYGAIKYLRKCRTLAPQQPTQLKNAHFKKPSFDKIPFEYNKTEQVLVQNGNHLQWFNKSPEKVYLRYWEKSNKDIKDEGVITLDFDNRKFEYMFTGEPPSSVSDDGAYIVVSCKIPDSPGDDKYQWKIPKHYLKRKSNFYQEHKHNYDWDAGDYLNGSWPDEDPELNKMHLEGPWDGHLQLVMENCRDERLLMLDILPDRDDVEWCFDQKLPTNTQVLTRPGLDILLVVRRDRVQVYDTKDSMRLISDKQHGILSPYLYQYEPRLQQGHAGDWVLTDTHLLHYHCFDRRLVAVSLDELMEDSETVPWVDLLHISVTMFDDDDGPNWQTATVDTTDRYLILTYNQLAGVGLVAIDTLTGCIYAYCLFLQELDSVQSAVYEVRKSQDGKKHAETLAAVVRRKSDIHDGIWAVDDLGTAVYVSNTRLEMCRTVYEKKKMQGSQKLRDIGAWIQAVDRPSNNNGWLRKLWGKKSRQNRTLRLV